MKSLRDHKKSERSCHPPIARFCKLVNEKYLIMFFESWSCFFSSSSSSLLFSLTVAGVVVFGGFPIVDVAER